MSQNSRLVNYFLSDFYRNKVFELKHVVSPNFEFSFQGEKAIGFSQYASRMIYLSKNCDLSILDAKTDDDTIFVSRFEMIIPQPFDNQIIASGVVKYKVEDGLLTKVVVLYDQTGANFEHIQDALAHNNQFKKSPENVEIDDILFI